MGVNKLFTYIKNKKKYKNRLRFDNTVSINEGSFFEGANKIESNSFFW